MKENSIKLETFIEKGPKFSKRLKIEDQEDATPETFMSGLRLVNSCLTLVTIAGDIYSMNNASEQDYWNVHDAPNLSIALRYLSQTIDTGDKNQAKEFVEEQRKMNVTSNVSILAKYADFDVQSDKVVFTLSDRTIPLLLVDKFIDIVTYYEGDGLDPTEQDEYKAYKRFFIWCCLNPRAEVAAELYRFLSENSFKITKQGFFVALRNVVTLAGSPELVHFVSNMYQKVKAVWRTNPLDYEVFKNNEDFCMIHTDNIEEDKFEEGYYGEHVGNLFEIYIDLPNRSENRFTDDWTKTFDIRIGKLTSMPSEQCNWSTQDCAAAGLHFTADQIHYVGCGDQSVLVLINPMKVVGIGQHKGRCYEYLPIMTVPREEATSILHNEAFDTLQLDEKYAVRCLKDLEKEVAMSFAKETTKQEFNLSSLTMSSLSAMVLELADIKEELLNRVVNI